METSYSDRRFWVSYILFIIIIGGILVLYIYIYITRLASNEIFSPSNKIGREVGRVKDLSPASTCLVNKNGRTNYFYLSYIYVLMAAWARRKYKGYLYQISFPRSLSACKTQKSLYKILCSVTTPSESPWFHKFIIWFTPDYVRQQLLNWSVMLKTAGPSGRAV
jgi:hypothetical protein